MASRRKKPDTLGLYEQIDFLEAATWLHSACCTPALSVQSDHYRTLTELNQAIHEAIGKIFGKEPPWASLPTVWEDWNEQARTATLAREFRHKAG